MLEFNGLFELCALVRWNSVPGGISQGWLYQGVKWPSARTV